MSGEFHMLVSGCVETPLVIKYEKETGRDPEKLSYALTGILPLRMMMT